MTSDRVSIATNPRLVLFAIFAAMAYGSAHAAGPACEAGESQCITDAQTFFETCLGQGRYPAPVCGTMFTTRENACVTALNSCTEMYTFPEGKLLSILYMPPGNKSTVGYSSTTSGSVTDTYINSFSSGSTFSATFSLLGVSLGGDFSDSNSSTETTVDTSSTQNTGTSTWATSGDPLDHTFDLLSIWLNPQLTVANFPSNAYQPGGIFSVLGNAAYSPSSGNGAPVNADEISSTDMDIINVTVANLQNPTQLLPSQLVSRTNSDGTVVPGLLSLCANRIPESECTEAEAQSNGCGCTAADFAPLVQLDPFFNPNISDHTIAGINSADPNNARFVPVVAQVGGDLELPLQYGDTVTYNLTDGYNTSTTYTNQVQQSYGATFGYSSGSGSPSSFGFKTSDSLTWSNSESVGVQTSSGASHTQSLTLGTTNPDCYEYVNIYEDTLYHTFVFDNGSDSGDPCP